MQRLDRAVAERGLAQSRARARDMILRGCVQVDGTVVNKAAAVVGSNSVIAVSDDLSHYVSRAAGKLLAGLDAAGFDPQGRVIVDLGASTGGFTQVCLERGAQRVFAIDVGHGQFAPDLRGDHRVTLLESLNARDLTLDHLDGIAPQAVVSDLSFISLRLGAEPALRLADAGAFAVLLVKPQFEVGRDGVGKGGIVRDEALIERTNTDIRTWFDGLPGWRCSAFLPSPLIGSDGNREYLLCGRKA